MSELGVVIVLAIALGIETVAIVLLAASIPFLWWKFFGQESRVRAQDNAICTQRDRIELCHARVDQVVADLGQVDEALTTLLEAAGLKKEVKGNAG